MQSVQELEAMIVEYYARYKGELTPSLFGDDDKPSWITGGGTATKSSEWDESKHPRVEKGSKAAHGGQFTKAKQQSLAGLTMAETVGKVGAKPDYNKRLEDLKERRDPDGIESNEKLPLFEQAAKVFEDAAKKPAKVQEERKPAKQSESSQWADDRKADEWEDSDEFQHVIDTTPRLKAMDKLVEKEVEDTINRGDYPDGDQVPSGPLERKLRQAVADEMARRGMEVPEEAYKVFRMNKPSLKLMDKEPEKEQKPKPAPQGPLKPQNVRERSKESARIKELMAEGMSRGDAQGVIEAEELMQSRRQAAKPENDLSASDRDTWMKQQAAKAVEHIKEGDDARKALAKLREGKSGAWWDKLDGMNSQELMKAKEWLAKYPPKQAGSIDYDERDARDEALRLALREKEANKASGAIQNKIHPAEFKKWEDLLEQASKPKESGIVMPSNTIPNEEAKPGDQLGLFGDAVKAPKTTFKPKLLEQKAKQGGLFDTKGNPDQMDLFGDGVMPDDLVYKPEAKKDVDADSIAKMAPGAIKRSEREQAASENGLSDAEANRKWAENHITIAADDITKLRKQDVYRVLDNAPNDKRGYLENWIQKRRPDLSQQVNEDSQEIDEERANAKPASFKPVLLDQKKSDEQEFPDAAKAAGVKSWKDAEKKGLKTFVTNHEAGVSAIADAIKPIRTRVNEGIATYTPKQFLEPLLRHTAIAGNADVGFDRAVDEYAKKSSFDGNQMDKIVIDERQIAARAIKESKSDILDAFRGKVSGPKEDPYGNEFAPGVSYSTISNSVAMNAHRGTSFVPEKRARSRQEEFAHTMNDVYAKLKNSAKNNPEKLAVLADEWPRFLERSKAHYNGALHSDSKIMSTMIAGGSNFPVRRMEKANQASHNKWGAYLEHLEKGKNAIFKKLNPELAPKKIGDADTGSHIEKKLESLKRNQELMKEANKVIAKVIDTKKSDRDNTVFKNGHDAKSAVAELVKIGMTEEVAKEITKGDFMGRYGFASYSLSNNNANIRRYEEQLKRQEKFESEAKAAESVGEQATSHDFEGGKVHLDYEDNRIRIAHDSKPSADVIAKLKSNGFRWSPQNKAWQRQLTNAAKYATHAITGVPLSKLTPKAEEKAEPKQDAPPDRKRDYWKNIESGLNADGKHRLSDGTIVSFGEGNKVLLTHSNGDVTEKEITPELMKKVGSKYQLTLARHIATEYIKSKYSAAFVPLFLERYSEPASTFVDDGDLFYDEKREQADREMYEAIAGACSVERYDTTWDESKHHRASKGTATGGQFTSNGGGAPASSSNRPGGALSPRLLEGSQMRVQSNDGGAWRQVKPTATPTQPASPKPQRGFSAKNRELADHPDLQTHHSLHIKNQDQRTAMKLNDYRAGFRNLLSNATRAAQFKVDDPHYQPDEETIWAHVDKNALQSLLTKVNQADHESIKGDGPKFHELVNANQIIPKMVAERLHGGSRFFDPEKLRGRWNEAKPPEAPKAEPKPNESVANKPEEKQADSPVYADAVEALKSLGHKPAEAKRLVDTAKASGDHSDVQSVLQSVYGKPKASAQQSVSQSQESAQSVPQPEKPKRAPITPEAMQGVFGEKLPEGVSKAMNTKLERRIKATIGDDPEIIKAFKPIVFDAWKQLTQEANDHNQAIRQVTNTAASLYDSIKHDDKSASAPPQKLTALVRMARNGSLDPSQKKGFDLMVDNAQRNFPQYLAGRGEDGFVDWLTDGIKPQPNLLDPEVGERAVSLAGSEFFRQFDQGEPPEQDETQGEDDWNDQFAWSVARVMVERYRREIAVERYYCDPTPAQREAGNFKMQHIRVHGLPISIETKKGEKRRAEWPTLAADYGYFKKTTGRDGDNIDVFVGPDKSSEMVFVIDQVGLNGKFDEHKVLLGFANQADAIATYQKCYHNGWKVGPVTAMTISQFKNWITSGKHSRPIAKQVSRYSFKPTLLASS